MSGATRSPLVWHVGGDDVHKRIPLLNALRARGFDVAAAGSEDGALFAESGIPYYRYDLHRKLSPRADIASCSQLSALFAHHRPDVVHGFDPKPAIAAPILAARQRVPARVRTITGLGFVMTSRSLQARALRPVYAFLQAWASAKAFTIFQNFDDRDYFQAHRLVKASRAEVVLGSGIDVQEMIAARPDQAGLADLRKSLRLSGTRVVTMISRIDENKGVSEFAEAARAVGEHRPDTTFLLVGPHENEGAWATQFLERLAAQPGNIQYLGPRRDIPAILALSDICVLPSYREGIPRVLIEAGAMSVACITCDVTGCRDVVRQGENGLLVPPRQAGPLADAIVKLLDDDRLREKMGETGYRIAREVFDLSYVADAYARIYRKCLAQEA